ncbi:low-density lipoprotein receptor 1-like [Xiphophorus maculatus]|uniref:low-density lipoprotein receptor 1-like n=1 Tax=Xiphophorus maculatus TaxID=8083 RepID=UPI000C6D9933|nr:low-density lipoprotein receptor 1-like [Xiphophorus maculatus]
MLKVLFVLGCLLCLTLAYSDDSASSREERSPGGPHFDRGHGPPHGKPGRPCIPEDVLQQILQILRTSTTTTTTTTATTTAAPTTAAPTTAAPTTTVAATT